MNSVLVNLLLLKVELHLMDGQRVLILRLEKITGVFKENEQIIGKSGKNTAVIDSVKKTTFAPVYCN